MCECWNLDWSLVIPQTFDHMGSAMATFFELSTTEGWVDVMYAGVDAAGVDMQPIRDHNPLWVFFFIAYMVIGSFFFTNLFVGVVIDNFNSMKEKLGENGSGIFMTERQTLWVKTFRATQALQPTRHPTSPSPDSAVVSMCFKLTMAPAFEISILVCIVLNSVIMGLQYFGQNATYGLALDIANFSFALVFMIEAMVKITASGGLRPYLGDSWNQFDFAIVCGTNVGIVLEALTSTNVGALATVVRVFRVGRILRLVQGFKSLRQILNTLLCTLPSLGNIGSLLMLLFFMYAIMGVQLFATVGYNGALNHHTNFQSFGQAMVTLMGFSTGENWNGFMHDVQVGFGEGCNPDVSYDPDMCGFSSNVETCVPLNGCGHWAILPYLYSFTLMITFVMLNLFIAVILEGFSDMNEDGAILSPDQLARFQLEWKLVDPEATGLVPAKDIAALLERVYLAFGLTGVMTAYEVNKSIVTMELPLYEGRVVHFSDVLKFTAQEVIYYNALENGEEVGDLDELQDEDRARSSVVRPRKLSNIDEGQDFSLETYFAAQKVQVSFQRYRRRKQASRPPRVEEE